MKGEIPLPKNRVEMFFEVIQNSYRKIIGISLMIFLFYLPFFLTILIVNYKSLEVLQNIDVTNESLLLAAIEKYYDIYFSSIALCFPGLIIFSLGLFGGFNVFKKLVWMEKVSIGKDFMQGIRKNIREGIYIGFLWTLLYSLIILNYYLISSSQENYIIVLIISIIIFLYFLDYICFSYCSGVVYKFSFANYLKSNFIFSIINFPITSLIIIISFLPGMIGLLFTFNEGFVIVSSIYGLMGFGIIILVMVLNCFKVFDKIINKEQYPHIYRKGLEGDQNE